MFRNTVAAQAAEVVAEAGKEHKPWPHRIVAFFSEKHISLVGVGRRDVEENQRSLGNQRLRTDMIRRVDDVPILVDPDGSRAVQDSDHQMSERAIPKDTGPAPSAPDATYVTTFTSLYKLANLLKSLQCQQFETCIGQITVASPMYVQQTCSIPHFTYIRIFQL